MAEMGYFKACQLLMSLLQCIKSARWPEDLSFSILPGIELGEKPRALPDSLAALSSQPAASISSLARKLQLPSSTAAQFTKAASFLPNLSVSISNVTPTGITISLVRRNAPSKPDYQIYAPRFPKPQTEGFFLLVCTATPSGQDGELLALKRISWPSPNKNGGGSGNRSITNASSSRNPPGGEPSKKPHSKGAGPLTVRSSVKFPEVVLAQQPGELRVNVKVISDSYPGMEWHLGNVNVDLGGKQKQQVVEESANYPAKE